MVTPALAVTSMTASSTINIFDNLPEYIEIGTQPQQNQIIAKESGKNKVIATVYSQNREELAWEDIPQVLKDATLAAEDRRFYEHGGIDIQGAVRAAVTTLSGSHTSGASTLSMQVVKNICISKAQVDNDGDEAAVDAAIDVCQAYSLDRKLKEMKYAIGLEKEYTKDEILLAYLNIAGFGGNVYGIESAAQRYYGIHAKDVSIDQAASLLAIVQQPGIRSLDNPDHYEANKARRDVILGNMRVEGTITQEQYEDALATPVSDKTVNLTAAKNGCIAADSYAKQFCDYIVKSVKDLEALGANADEREKNWRIGGYKIYTTLDLKLQKVSQDAVREYAPRNETRMQLGASAISIEVGTGRILTMAQNKRFDDTSSGGGRSATAVNFNTDVEYGGSAGFQVGSTYKVFTLLNWLEAGRGLNERVLATARTVNQADFTDSCGGPWTQTWKFRNDDGSGGYQTVRQATVASVNGAYVSMALQLDLCDTKKIAERLGVHTALVKDNPDTTLVVENELGTNPSSILGTNDIAPMTVAAAYAGIANDGVFCEPYAVTQVVDSFGEKLGGQGEKCGQAISKDVANAAQSALGSAMDRYNANPHDGTELIGKTGTTNDSKQTWVTSASTAVATTVWVGNISGNYPMRSYPNGGELRHLISNKIMTAADKSYEGGSFDDPPENLIKGQSFPVGNYIGMTADVAQTAIEGSQLDYSKAGQVDSSLPEGQVAKQSPEAGTPAGRGMKVTVWLSNGKESEVPDVKGQDVATAKNTLADAGFTKIAEKCIVLSPDELGGDPGDGDKPGKGNDDEENTQQESQEGLVQSTNPKKGTSLLRTDQIVLNVGHASC